MRILTKMGVFVLDKKKPIIEGLERFRQQQNISFHVPGHKHGELSHLPQACKDVMRYDVTELTDLDELHYPEGMILEAENLLLFNEMHINLYFMPLNLLE